MAKGRPIALIIKVQVFKNPPRVKPETMHLISEIPEPAAAGA